VQDHTVLTAGAAPPPRESLDGAWRLDAIATSNHPLRVADVSFERQPDGRIQSRCSPVAGLPVLLPAFAIEHFTREDAGGLAGDLRQIDERTLLGTWTTAIRGPYARLLLGGSLGLFHAERTRGIGRRFTMRYILGRG
jgi:hypothetical protein